MEIKQHKEYLIHVPQGRSARLEKDNVNSSCIKGLHTDGFSTCTIVVCIGENKILLTHADPQTDAKKIVEGLEWFKDTPKEIVMLRRPGIPLLLGEVFANLDSVKVVDVSTNYDGIVVSFGEQTTNSIHPQIEILPIYKRPGNLIHHPQEKEFVAIQKIGQIIGLRERAETKKFILVPKQQIIFDGSWEPLLETELTMSSHPTTREEIDFFDKNDTLAELGGKFLGLIENIKSFGIPFLGDPKENAASVAFYMEEHLNNFDAELLFRRNLKDAINNYSPISSNDKSFKDTLNKLLETSRSFAEINNVVNAYDQASPPTNFKKDILDEYRTFLRHYTDRLYYQEKAKNIKTNTTCMIEYARCGTDYYRSKNYVDSTKSFTECLTLATTCCLKTDPRLATAYHNLGRSLQKQNQIESALFFLDKALLLRKNYIKSDNNPSHVKTTEGAISECKQALALLASPISMPPSIFEIAVFNRLFFTPPERDMKDQARSYLFRFFSDRDRKSFGCISRSCHTLQQEIEAFYEKRSHR